MVYKVWNTHALIAFINPRSCVEHFLWWMDAQFWTSKSQPPFTAIIKLGRARTFFNVTPTVFVWKKKVIYCTPKNGFRVSESWGNFHFWWTIPLIVIKPFQFPFTSIVFFFFFVQIQWEPELFGYQHSNMHFWATVTFGWTIIKHFSHE